MIQEYITQFSRLLRVKRYSNNTIRSYISNVEDFLKYFKSIEPKDIKNAEIFRYLEHKIIDDKISFSYQKGIVGSIKLFYKLVLNSDIKVDYIYLLIDQNTNFQIYYQQKKFQISLKIFQIKSTKP